MPRAVHSMRAASESFRSECAQRVHGNDPFFLASSVERSAAGRAGGAAIRVASMLPRARLVAGRGLDQVEHAELRVAVGHVSV